MGYDVQKARSMAAMLTSDSASPNGNDKDKYDIISDTTCFLTLTALWYDVQQVRSMSAKLTKCTQEARLICRQKGVLEDKMETVRPILDVFGKFVPDKHPLRDLLDEVDDKLDLHAG